MRSYLEDNLSLQRVLLALKYSLSVRGYSENFKGGIGSYCLFVMVAAYFKEFKETRESMDCEILLDILKFYGEDFENQLKVVVLAEGDGRNYV
jgi:DNA polymerase sigma